MTTLLWNKQPIHTMDYTYLSNTIKYLEGRAKEDYECEERDERLDDPKRDWTDYLPEVYWEILKEKELREKTNRIHEDLPNF